MASLRLPMALSKTSDSPTKSKRQMESPAFNAALGGLLFAAGRFWEALGSEDLFY